MSKGNFATEQAAKTALRAHLDHDGAFVVAFDDGSFDFYLYGQPVSSYNGRNYRIYDTSEYKLLAVWRGAWLNQLALPFEEQP